jgi:hypothetical protein
MVDNTSLFPVWKQLVKVASAWEYGTLHTHTEIADVINLDAQTNKYYQTVSSANIELTLTGKRLAIVQGEGYMVVKPGEYPEDSRKQKDKGLRHYKIAAMVTGCAPVERMTDKERAINDQCHGLNTALVTMLKKDQTKEYKLLNLTHKLKLNARNPETNPEVSHETT